MMFLKPKKPRKFEYTPLFYNPDKEKHTKRREIHFRRLRASGNASGASFWIYLILFVLALIIYWYTKA